MDVSIVDLYIELMLKCVGIKDFVQSNHVPNAMKPYQKAVFDARVKIAFAIAMALASTINYELKHD